MISRSFRAPKNQSYFLLGPRGTGKSYYLKHKHPKSLYINLLIDEDYQSLLANPSRLKDFIGTQKHEWVIIDEIQKIPALLDEVHWMIEEKKQKFILTGSSARKLKRGGANLLAGRALNLYSHPFCALELAKDFDLKKALLNGLLPMAYLGENPRAYLASYISSYLKEEIMQEGLIRNLSSFARFLEAASFSQGQILNISNVAKECSVERKSVSNYFQILEDLLLTHSLDVFSLRAKRDLLKHKKFYFFDTGVSRQIRPKGPLDSETELTGLCLETLVLQEIVARNDYLDREYKISYWRTRLGLEVDFILYGKNGLKAIEVKSSSRIRDQDLVGLLEFKKDYPQAKLYIIYGGTTEKQYKDVHWIPAESFFRNNELNIV